jgi:hypothetical protein
MGYLEILCSQMYSMYSSHMFCTKSFSCKLCNLPKGAYYIMSVFSVQKLLITLTSLDPVDMFYFKESVELGVLFF